MFGMAPRYIDVTFKKDGETVFEGRAGLGCVVQGMPQDGYQAIRQAFAQLQEANSAGTASVDAMTFTSVEVMGREFTREQLIKAGVVTQVRTCGSTKPPTKGPKF